MTNAARAIFTQEVLPLFEQSRASWLDMARREARYLARKFGTVTIDQVRQACPPPEGVDPRCMGAVLSSKDFECIGFENSDRRACHGRPIRRFKLRGT